MADKFEHVEGCTYGDHIAETCLQAEQRSLLRARHTYEPPPEVVSDSDLAAAYVGWRIAHDEACPQGMFCSAHQSIEAPARKLRVVAALLADERFMNIKDRDLLLKHAQDHPLPRID